jgi:hypothetical protein
VGERSVSIYLPEGMKKSIEDSGKDLESWWHEAITLGLLVNKGKIFQLVGDDVTRISMQDIDPLPKPLLRTSEMRDFKFELKPNVYSGIRLLFSDVDDWCRRAAALRYRAESIELVYFNGSEYSMLYVNK